MTYLYCDSCAVKFDLLNGHSNDSGDYCDDCYEEMWKQGAREAGIPESVIQGESKLSDHFSKEYIDYKCNKEEK